jgi:mRNA interferase RelE/StbE
VRYRVQLVSEAEKSLAGLPIKQQQHIARNIDSLAENPRPSTSKKLKGSDLPIYRLVSGGFRVVYHVDDEASIVLVVRIGDRKSVDRRLR